MKVHIGKKNWIWIIVASLFIIHLILIPFVNPEGSLLNFPFLLLSFPWLWLAIIFDIPLPNRLGGFLVFICIMWTLNCLLIVTFRKFQKKVIFFNLKTLFLMWAINIALFIVGFLIDLFLPSYADDLMIVDLITYPWCLLRSLFGSCGLFENPVYLAFVMNSTILGILTGVYIRRLRKTR